MLCLFEKRAHRTRTGTNSHHDSRVCAKATVRRQTEELNLNLLLFREERKPTSQHLHNLTNNLLISAMSTPKYKTDVLGVCAGLFLDQARR